ncbi:transcription factor tfiia complex subunit [Colletotrichum truncatum]|uniref:Transcription factor tfiia complex subunit n=1 Tax=Colletotrichum truncatum TaxID=5467 RepID=A0ACC3YTS9_COLTU|nr:transcription factor tfiia complex subunit [Colletotrichum truncatum]KAF6798544.1 transcription factor tfiia complex subunit [Colletotrichum truncatum]
MSNNAVGNVYSQIIDEVINSSRVDFEEGGVDENVLEELKKGWQEKLSQLEVASFPWDPKPEAAPPAAPPPTTAVPPPQAAPYSQAQLSPQPPLPGLPLPVAPADQARNLAVKEEPYIKPEPGLQNVALPPSQTDAQGANLAAIRAAQHVRGQFGEKGAGSINAIQSSATNRPAGQPPLPQMPGQPVQQQYRPSQPQQPGQQQRPTSNGQPGLNPSQTDGAIDDDFDFEGVLLQRNADGTQRELGRVDIDRMIHARIAANAKSMEGGGLMLPLKEATKHKAAANSRSKGKEHGVAPYDGYDDDELDDDAINSDLDDPDEDKDEDEVDDEGLGHIMLCMYDKVQRVKNKWKCILKDGVLTVNGKEYVFHKATGEYEW